MKPRRLALVLIGLVLLLAGFLFVQIARYKNAERTLLRAMPPANTYILITPEGTNLILSVQGSAVPVLLHWSVGRDPFWARFFDKVRNRLNLATVPRSPWSKAHQARLAFTVLREKAVSAVPELTRRLSDPDRDVRRYAVHMLAAIGPAIGPDAFSRMTNCLSDSDREVRNDLIWSLQFHPYACPPEVQVPIFVAGLRESYVVARQNAIWGLVKLGTNAEAARDVIRAAQKDPDDSVSSNARNWLKNPEFFQAPR
jgi:hypothetical protein